MRLLDERWLNTYLYQKSTFALSRIDLKVNFVSSCILYAKPSFIFNKDGSFRQFGVGRSRKTVIPIWLLAFIIGILSYLAVAYYVAHPQLSAIE